MSLVIIMLLLLVAGCTIVPVVEHADVKVPCGNALLILWGCYDLPTRTIHLQAGMEPWLRECILEHELKHARGYGTELDLNEPASLCFANKKENSDGYK